MEAERTNGSGEPSRLRHGRVGEPVSRLDGALKVRGAATFAAEFAPEGMAHAALVLGTIAKGRLAAIDTDAAEALEFQAPRHLRRARPPSRHAAQRRADERL